MVILGTRVSRDEECSDDCLIFKIWGTPGPVIGYIYGIRIDQDRRYNNCWDRRLNYFWGSVFKTVSCPKCIACILYICHRWLTSTARKHIEEGGQLGKPVLKCRCAIFYFYPLPTVSSKNLSKNGLKNWATGGQKSVSTIDCSTIQMGLKSSVLTDSQEVWLTSNK